MQQGIQEEVGVPQQVEQLIEEPEINMFGLNRFLQALYLKRRNLTMIFAGIATLITFDFFCLLVLPFQIYFSEQVIVIKNHEKMNFFIMRESAQLVLLSLILYALRMKASLPEFYTSDVLPNPEIVGLDIAGGGIFGARQQRVKLAKIFHLNLKRRKLADRSVDMESKLSQALSEWNDPANASKGSQADSSSLSGNSFKDHKFLILNPTDFTPDKNLKRLTTT